MKSRRLKVVFISLVGMLLAGYGSWRAYQHFHPLRARQVPLYPYEQSVHLHDTALKGYIIMSPGQPRRTDKGQLLIMDMGGKIVYQKFLPGSVSDFRQWQLNGKVYYTYLFNDTDAYRVKNIRMLVGYGVLLDSALNEIKKIRLIPHNDIVLNHRQGLDLHDIILLSDRHYFTMAYYEKHVRNIPDSIKHAAGVKILAPIIQEVDNDKVIWQWDGSNYPELYGTSVAANHFTDALHTQDYLHVNSMVLDPRDSNLIVSMRNAHQVLKISRKTGKVLWKLGGKNSDFKLTGEQAFIGQHNASVLDDGSLLLFDNGETGIRSSSRIVELRLDEKNKKVISFKALTIPGFFSQTMGSVTRKGNYYFIGGGSGKYVLIIDSKTGEKHYELAMSQPSYRAYWVERF